MAARNIANVDAVDRLIDRIEAAPELMPISHWVRTVARNWVLRHHDRTVPVAEAGPGAPDWLTAALARGDAVVALVIDDGLEKRLRAAADEIMCRWRDCLGDIERVSLPDAEAAVAARAAALADALVEGRDWQPVYEDETGWTVVRLLTRRALAHEGVALANCLRNGDYAGRVEAGRVRLYSVRSVTGKAKAVLAVDSAGDVLEHAGRRNHAVSAKAFEVIQRFLADQGFRPEDYDLDGVEAMVAASGGFDPSDDAETR